MALRVWSVWMLTVVRVVRAVRAWWTRPVTNPRPWLMPKPAADTRRCGRHAVGEATVPLADLLAQLDVSVAPRRRREPVLFGTDPLHEWTHPERYGPPVRPPMHESTARVSSPFDDTEVSA